MSLPQWLLWCHRTRDHGALGVHDARVHDGKVHDDRVGQGVRAVLEVQEVHGVLARYDRGEEGLLVKGARDGEDRVVLGVRDGEG